MRPNFLSVDVEEWFHLLMSGSPPESEWTSLPSRVQPATHRILDDMRDRGVHGTFFILGWVAARQPSLLRDIKEDGHEIACHGYAHRLVHTQTPGEFRDDLRRAAEAIHAACEVIPRGYRAPGFSIKPECSWAFDILREEGFTYDSSIFPARCLHGHFPGIQFAPFMFPNGLAEFPITVIGPARWGVPFLGGGYLRILPLSAVLSLSRCVEAAGRPLVLYIHPRDLDADQPRISLSRIHRVRVYSGLAGCQKKIRRLLQCFEWTRIEDGVAQLSVARGDDDCRLHAS